MDMEIKIIDIKKATSQEIMETLDENNRKVTLMSTEIEKLKKVASEERKIIIDSPKKPYIELSGEEEEEDSLEEELSYYVENFNNATLEELTESTDDILPSQENPNYQNIMLRLQIELLKSIKEVNDIIKETGKGNQEELEYYKEELQQLRKKLDLLNSPVEKDTKGEDQRKNTLIFAPTPSGNIRVLEEIEKRIPQEYYAGFQGLFESIQTGRFKNVRRFVASNAKTAGFSEVKDHKIRVVFDRIGPHAYVVITAFMKKSDKDKGYIDPLKGILADYKNQYRNKLKENLRNPEFLDLQQHYEQELFNKLSKVEEKPLERVKTNENTRPSKGNN